jgi:diaminopimelate epimerase
MKFTKMHGLGNCYIYVNCFEEKVTDPAALSRAISDRNTGVGSDGLILIYPSEKADARFEIYNMDGSRGQMCGNGSRCVAKYVYDHALSRRNPLRIDSDAGLLTLELMLRNDKVDMVRVDLGPPRLTPEEVPTTLRKDQLIEHGIQVRGKPAKMTTVSLGNPHVVVYDVPLEMLPPDHLALEGRKLENCPLFPQRTNVHFVEVQGPSEVSVLHWERGSGPTQACGTGVAAVCVAGVLTGRSGRQITAHLPGGDLRMEWNERDNHVYMTGPAVEIFSGDWPTGK